MKKSIAALPLIMIIALVLISLGNFIGKTESLAPIVQAAAENPGFQNDAPWWLKFWDAAKDKAESAIQWFQGYTGSAVGGRAGGISSSSQNQFPLAQQFPAINKTVPNSGISTTTPSGGGTTGGTVPTVNPVGGNTGSQSGSGDMYGSNGSDRKPYVLEPNQFKKVCGKNEYVLWWSKRGSDGQDLKEVAHKMDNAWLVVPSCKELAKCHCCCNTCTSDKSTPCPEDVCFSVFKPCDSEPVCNSKCYCSKCSSECEQYKEAFHPKAFDHDCGCEKQGCPDGDGCKIVFSKNERGWRWGKYVQSGPGSWSLEQETPKLSKQAEREDNSKNIMLFQTTSPDSAPGGNGWVDKLEQDKGKCCKCIPEMVADEGPNGSGGQK
jgi:hypothetical protein